MSRCDHESGGGLGFWGFALALIAGFYILSMEPTPTTELAAGTDTTAVAGVVEPVTPTTTPRLTGAGGSGVVEPDRPRSQDRSTGVEGTTETGDGLADNMRQFAECMVTDPFGPIYCAEKTAGH